MRIGVLSAALTALLAIPASAADASTIRVDPAHDGGCTAGKCRTIAEALAAAQAGDVIEIAPGTYQESPNVTKRVELRGAGAQTQIVGSGTGDVLTLGAAGATVRDLAVQAPADAQSAVAMSAADTLLSGVIAQRTAGAEPVVDVVHGPATLERSYVVQGSPTGIAAVRSSAPGGLRLDGSVVVSSKGPAAIIADSAVNALVRSMLATTDAAAHGVEVISASGSPSAKGLVVDSTAVVGGSETGRAGILAHTQKLNVTPSSAGSIELVVRHSTVLGANGILAWADAAHAATDAGKGDVTARVSSSIVHGETGTRTSAGSLLESPTTATVTFTSSYSPASSAAGVTGAGDMYGTSSPYEMFRKGGFGLRADAPVIDKGGPVEDGEPQSDLDGEPRAVDGDRDGTATSDIGADEFVNRAPAVKLATGDAAPKRGKSVEFAASASDPEQDAGGGIVEYRWDFGDGTRETGTSASVQHAFAQRGTFHVTVTAVDRQGATAASQAVTVTVRDGTPPKIAIAIPEIGKRYTLNPRARKGSRRRPKPIQFGAMGVATDDDRVAKVEVALTLTRRDPVARSKKRKGSKRRPGRSAAGCEHFAGTRFVKGACDAPRWIEVSVVGTGWSFGAPRGMRFPAGRYEMRMRAVDAAGNATPAPNAAARTLVAFRVK